MKWIAVVGSGISGLAAAYFLSRRHHVWLFEKEHRLGGHTHTITVGAVPLDTGFLVHNDRTYPNLARLFDEIGIATETSDMCFGVMCRRTGLEYSSRGPRGFFAQRRNLFRPAHLRLLADIVRFNRVATSLLARPDASRITLGDFLDSYRFSEAFVRHYLVPMASAIWSSSPEAIARFPALTLVRFLDNHGLLAIGGQPIWKTVRGGSRRYIPKLTRPLGDRVVCDARIAGVARHESGVTMRFADRQPMTFDEIVLACHGDEVLPLLADASDRERDVFGSFRTTANVTWLHTDESVLPRRARARASWNYVLAEDPDRPPTVTYHLNRLQNLATAEQFCVTLNPPEGAIDPSRVLRRLVYTPCTRARPSRPRRAGIRSAASGARTTAAPTGSTDSTKTASTPRCASRAIWESTGDRLVGVCRDAEAPALRTGCARLHLPPLHGPAGRRSSGRAHGDLPVPELEPFQLGDVRRPRSLRRPATVTIFRTAASSC
jgi:predicted NAD/FAD-binding protein